MIARATRQRKSRVVDATRTQVLSVESNQCTIFGVMKVLLGGGHAAIILDGVLAVRRGT